MEVQLNLLLFARNYTSVGKSFRPGFSFVGGPDGLPTKMLTAELSLDKSLQQLINSATELNAGFLIPALSEVDKNYDQDILHIYYVDEIPYETKPKNPYTWKNEPNEFLKKLVQKSRKFNASNAGTIKSTVG